MKITNEQLKKLVVGAVQSEEAEKGLRFYKMTNKQMGAFASINEFLGKGARASTGIRLDFTTNSKYVSFTSIGGMGFEYLIDGQYRGKIGFRPDGSDKDVKIELDKPCRFTLCFSSHGISEIANLEIEDGAKIERYNLKEKVLFIGDSITQGWNSGIDVYSYAYRTSLALDFDSIIQGVGGSFCASTTVDYCGFTPDRVIVAYGTNDVRQNVTQNQLLERVREYLALVKATYKGAKLYAISPVWVSGGEIEKPAGNVFENYEKIEQEIKNAGFFHIRGMDLIPHDRKYYADDFHPNADGFQCYADNLVKILKNN